MLSVSCNRFNRRKILQQKKKKRFLDPAREVEVVRNHHAQDPGLNPGPDHYHQNELFRRQCAKAQSHQSNRRKSGRESVANDRVRRRQVLGKFLNSGRFYQWLKNKNLFLQ